MLWWAHERPADYARIAKFLTPSSYVAGRAVGLRADEAFIDTTFLHFTGVADAVAGAWSSELCDTLEIDARRLPRIVEPWTVVGELTPEAARDFGLAPGTPVAAGCGDTAAGALGAGVVRPGMLLDTAGTASVLACCTDRFVADVTHRALIVMRSVVPGVWNPLAYVGGGGLAVQWFCRNFAGTAPRTKALTNSSPPPQMRRPDAAASCSRLISAGASARPRRECAAPGRAFPGGTRATHFFRAILESIAYEYAWYLRILRGLAPELDLVEARVIGGGGQERGLEPDQGRRPVGSLPETRAQGMRRVGERLGRRQGLRTDYGFGGGRNGLESSGGRGARAEPGVAADTRCCSGPLSVLAAQARVGYLNA